MDFVIQNRNQFKPVAPAEKELMANHKRTRAFRRNHILRTKAKTFKKLKQWGLIKLYDFLRRSDEEEGYDNAGTIGRWNSTHCRPCSCHGCGNPRKYENKVTWQEYKSKISEIEQLNEIRE